MDSRFGVLAGILFCGHRGAAHVYLLYRPIATLSVYTTFIIKESKNPNIFGADLLVFTWSQYNSLVPWRYLATRTKLPASSR